MQHCMAYETLLTVTLFSFLLPRKMSDPMEVTLEGIVTVCSLSQYEKAMNPMDVI